jgi:hypothetical protein
MTAAIADVLEKASDLRALAERAERHAIGLAVGAFGDDYWGDASIMARAADLLTVAAALKAHAEKDRSA